MRRIIPAFRSGRAFVRFNSSSSEASYIEDRALVKSFDGLVPKLASAYNTVMNSNARAEMKRLIDGKVLVPAYVPALACFSQLQNPVLKKYKFNPVEFMEGATEAFKQIHLAIASTEFSKFCNGERKESPKADLLKASLSPYLFDACTRAARHLYKGDKTLVMTHVDVSKRALLSLETFIYVDLLASHKKLVDDTVNALLKKETPDKTDVSPIKASTDDPIHDAVVNNLEDYDIEVAEQTFTEGSVIVRATVMYEAEETYAETNNLSKSHSRLAHSMWTFEGCISGNDHPIC